MPSATAPTIQPQAAPLNESALRQLHNLSSQQSDVQKRLQLRLAKAAELLTEVAGVLNDRAQEDRTRHERKLVRLQANGEEEDEDDREKYEEFQTKVQNLTRSMDKNMRRVIDDRTWLQELPDAFAQINSKSRLLSQATQRSTQLPTQDDMEVEEQQQVSTGPPAAADAPSALLSTAFATQTAKWDSKTLTEKYAHHNDYAGFYKTIYDAKNPGDAAPPVPAPGLWFAEEEGRGGASSQPVGEDAAEGEDSDFEIAAERVRIKCPITLQYFKDPVTSNKCKHSYERTAILSMLKSSTDHVPYTDEQLVVLSQIPTRDRIRRERYQNEINIPQVSCPECRVPLAEVDLRPDPVLLRKVNRILEKERREEAAATSDIDEEEDELPRGSQRKPYGLGSSPMARSQRLARIKAERASSIVPQTQL